MNICLCYNAAVFLVLCFLHGTKGKQPPQIIVERKVSKYGENLQLFCKIDDCCLNAAGWAVDRDLLFIDISLINLSSALKDVRYKASYDTSGVRLVIQNFSTSDLNKSHECIYDGDQVSRILFYDDVFSNNTFQVDGPETDLGTGYLVMAAALAGVLVILALVGLFFMWRKKGKLNLGDEEMESITSKNQQQCDEEMQSITSKNQQQCDEKMQSITSKNQQQCDEEMQSITSKNQQQCDEKMQSITSKNQQQYEQQWIELFINIGNEIAVVWTTLGRMLGLTDAVISSTDKDMFQPADKAFAILEKWIYLTGSSAAKEKLSGCLEKLNLTSVAVKVQEHFSVAGMNWEKFEFKQQWFPLFIKIGNNITADWKTLGRMSGLTDAEISSIANEMFQPADKAFTMLENWINNKGSSATKDKLSECLDKLSLTSVAVIVQKLFAVTLIIIIILVILGMI